MKWWWGDRNGGNKNKYQMHNVSPTGAPVRDKGNSQTNIQHLEHTQKKKKHRYINQQSSYSVCVRERESEYE